MEHIEPDFQSTLDHALSAYAEQDWPEAIRRFDDLRLRFPDDLTGYRYGGELLFARGQFDEADHVIREGMARFPAEVALAISYAWFAHLKADQTGEWGEAIDRWRGLAATFPATPPWPDDGGVCADATSGHVQTEAETVLLDAMQRFPDEIDMAVQYASVADFRQDWEEAMRRWDALLLRWPKAQAVVDGRGETETRRRLREVEKSDAFVPSPVTDPVPQTEAEIARHVFMQFESLGENCEFGLAQRHFGAEPLGLLRWMASSPDQLCMALEHEFAGLDDGEDYEIKMSGPESFLHEKRYQMEMHTFILKSEYQGTQDQLHNQLTHRMRYLKRKLLDDLRTAEKVFVWQSGIGSSLSDETVVRMHRALRSFGRNTLLIIRRHNDAARAPHVALIQPGLLVGSLHQVEPIGDESDRMSSPFAAWLSVCRAALQMRAQTLNP